MSDRLRAVDLCAGAGGWACAARGLPIDVVVAVDFWEPACKTYELNHPGTRVLCGDVRSREVAHTVIAAKPDIVVGGIPCQWLSSYRALTPVKAAETGKERETLDAVLAMVKRIGPRWWALEDVVALIRELPPLTPYQVLNSRLWSAQRRKRVFVGEFPAPRPPRSNLVLKDKVRPGPFRVGRRLLGRTPQTHRTFTSTTTLAAYLDRKSPTICVQCSRRDAELGVVDERLGGGLRQLEWQEQAVLQGFPEDYLFYGSPTDVGKQVGRAIQIDTGRAILEAIVAEWKGAE